jgi:hypothetical protein
MARNGLAGSKNGKSDSAKFYHENEDARKRKQAYDKKYHSTKKRRKYRSLLNAINRKNGDYGNHDGKDVAHVSKTKTKKQDQSKNRGDKKNIHFK